MSDLSDAPNIADWLTAVAAVAALGLVVAQIRHTTRATAIDTARKFLDDTRDHWDLCMAAAGAPTFSSDQFKKHLYDLVAQLELNAVALSEMSFPDRIHSLIERTMVTFMNEMIVSGYDPYLSQIFSNNIMCPCLKDFCLQRVSLFDDPHRLMSALNIARYRYV
jgi:hypothetical protein